MTGAGSWQPDSAGAAASRCVTEVKPMAQAACDKSAATAVNAATLTVNWTIERMPMQHKL